MTAFVQRSFSGGEIAPSMHGRIDLVKYATGAVVIRNWIVNRHGGLTNKPGSKWVCHAKNMSDRMRLVAFRVSKDETYINVHTDSTMRVIQEGALVTDSDFSYPIAGVSTTNPCILQIPGHALVIGDEFAVAGVNGTIEINGRNFLVLNTDPTNITIGFLNGDAVDGSGFTAWDSGGTADKIFEIETPYPESVLQQIHKSQTAAVMTLTHQKHPVQNLTRLNVDDWLIEEETFTPKVQGTINGIVTIGPVGSKTFKYMVTSIDPEDNQESLPSLDALQGVVSMTMSNPVSVEVATHTYDDGDSIEFASLGGANGADELIGRRFFIDVTDPDNFTLRDEDGTGYTPYVSGGACARENLTLDSAGDPSTVNPHTISWDAKPGINQFSIYKEDNGEYGFIGVATGTSFKDTGIDPDLTDTPPRFRNPFHGEGNYPRTSGYVQQRRGFASTENDVELVNWSEIGDFKGFRRRTPLQDDDAVRYKIEGSEINDVMHLITVNGKLVNLTESGEWLIGGDAGGTLTPIEVNPNQHSYNGASQIQPVVINDTAVYVQALDSTIRELNFSFDIDGISGDDLTLNSAHLFDNFGIVAMAYQKVPHSILWVVRNDGVLLGFTFNKSQKMTAWHQHYIEGGFVEDVEVVREGQEEAVYMAVRYEMDITGTDTFETVRNVERMESHKIKNAKEWVFLDSAATVDGRNTDTGRTMTLTAIEVAPSWDFEQLLTLTCSEAYFLELMKTQQDIIQITGTRDVVHPVTGKTLKIPQTIELTIEDFTDDQNVTVRPDTEVPGSLQAVAVDEWAYATKFIGGGWHLEGEQVSVFADGHVIASAKNENEYSAVVIKNGSFTLDYPRAVVHYGRPITSDLETLDIDTVNGETLADKKSLVSNVTFHLNQSRSFWVGPQAPSNDDNDPLEGLNEMKLGSIEESQDPVEVFSGKIDVPITGKYTGGGRTFTRHIDPTFVEILQIVPRGKVPLSGGGR